MWSWSCCRALNSADEEKFDAYRLVCAHHCDCRAIFHRNDFGARAQNSQAAAQSSAQAVADVFHEAESKYMFGFIDGSDIGNEGEKAIEYEATGSFQKRGGRYSAIEHELAFEHVLTQNFARMKLAPTDLRIRSAVSRISTIVTVHSSAACRRSCAISSSAAVPARLSA